MHKGWDAGMAAGTAVRLRRKPQGEAGNRRADKGGIWVTRMDQQTHEHNSRPIICCTCARTCNIEALLKH